jgi:hypothetical protein
MGRFDSTWNWRMCRRHVLAALWVFLLVGGVPAMSAGERISDPETLLANGDFVTRGRSFLQVHAWRGSVAVAGIDSILSGRYRAVTRLCDLLETSPPPSVHVFFYPDEATKLAQTGHRGLGWGVGTTVIEVRNDSISVDPYHELAHIVLYQMGSPPAIWDEGFAVYASARLGADALQLLGYPGATIDEALMRHLTGKEPYPWQELAALDEIGNASDVVLAYLQSASFVNFVATEFGDESLRDILSAVAKDTPRDPLERSNAALRSSLGRSGSEVWTRWRIRMERNR